MFEAAFLLGLASPLVAAGQQILVTGAQTPLKIARTPGGNFVVAETGTGADDGRVSLLSRWGDRFTLLSGLPSAINVEGGGEPNGPQGIAQAHTTLYVLIGSGDVVGSVSPPVSFPNDQGPSSPLFSSLLRARFEPVPDGIREGFELTSAQLRRLADGHDVTIENDREERVELTLLTDFRDLERDPIVGVRASNPFALQIVGGLTPEDLVELGRTELSLDQADFLARLFPKTALGRRLEERSTIYALDASANAILGIDPVSGRSRVLGRIPPLPNPLFPNLGGPVVDSVPTGLRVRSDGTLLVSLLSGFPFAAGVAAILQFDPASGAISPYIGGLTTVTDLLEVGGATYVLEFSTDFLSGAPGRVLRFSTPAGPPTVVAEGLISPAGLELDPRRNELLVTETFTGRVLRVPLEEDADRTSRVR